MGEISDIYRLNFICVSVKHLGHSLSEQLLLDIAFLIAPVCIFLFFSFLEGRTGKNVLNNKQ